MNTKPQFHFDYNIKQTAPLGFVQRSLIRLAIKRDLKSVVGIKRPHVSLNRSGKLRISAVLKPGATNYSVANQMFRRANKLNS